MNKILLALVGILIPAVVFCQARLMIEGASPVTIVENGGVQATPIYIEINNSAANAITVAGSDGWIISESEYDMVKWDIGTNTGTYVIPFGYSTSYYLPLTADISAAGTGSGSILFSTWHTIADQFTGVVSTTGDPFDVTTMAAAGAGGDPTANDNSYNAVDRFWILDSYHGSFSYTTKPTLSDITFSYIHGNGTNEPAEFAPNNNSAEEDDLLAQRFNPSVADGGTGFGWGDWFGTPGTDVFPGTIGTVSSGAIPVADFYRSWTLTNSEVPLPIVLSAFTDQCYNGSALLRWTSQTELNNDYYTVKKTTDDIHFETVGTVKGSGTTSSPVNYSLIDNAPYAGTSYYILYQTDFDGNTVELGNLLFTGCGTPQVTTINGYNTTNCIVVQITAVAPDNYDISLVNMLGQTLFRENCSVALGYNEIRLPNNESPGMYILNIRNDKQNYAKKLILGVR